MSTRAQQPALSRGPIFLHVWFPVVLVGSFVVWTLPDPDLPAYDLRRLLQVCSLVVVGGWVAVRPEARSRLAGGFLRLPRSARWGLSVAVILGMLASVVAPRPEIAIREVSLWVLLAALALLVAGGRRRSESPAEMAVVDAAVIAGIAYVGLYLVDAVVSGTAITLPGFEHPRQFNHTQVLMLPLLAAATVSERWTSRQRVILWIALVSWWHMLFVSGGRAALLATALGIVVGAAVVRPDAVRWAVTYVLTGVAGAVVYMVAVLGLGTEAPTPYYGIANAVERGATVTGRGHLWDLAIEYIGADPVLGIGPGHYAHERYVAGFAASPHNLPLQFAAEWGLIAASVLLVLAAWGLLAWIRNVHRRAGGPFGAALTAGLVGVTVDAMFGGSVNDPTAALLAAGVVGLGLGRSRGAERPDETGAPVGMLLVVVIATIALATTTALTYRSPADETGTILRPRFWLNGVVTERNS